MSADREPLDAVLFRVNDGLAYHVYHVDRATGNRIALEDEARAFREEAAASQTLQDLLDKESRQLRDWVDGQPDDVRRAVLRALQVEQSMSQHPSNGVGL